ncbi:MAG: transglutaminase domain-containing protein [Dehalococcoidales bacterium]|nr:transglutaminase domain-containing protein [Dehalococcoidales bacterium]
MRFRIIFAVIAIAAIGLTISGLLVVLQLLSNEKLSATETLATDSTDMQSPVSDKPVETNHSGDLQQTAVITAGSHTVQNVPDGIPVTVPSDACPVCQGLLKKGSGLCSICGGSGKLISGQQISPCISPEGGLAPSIPLFQLEGVDGTSLLRSVVTSCYDGNVWYPASDAQHYEYKGEEITSLVNLYAGQTVNEINVTSLEEFPASGTVLPTGLYPVSVSSSMPLTYFPCEQQFFSPEGLPESYSFKTISYTYNDSQLNGAEIDTDTRYQQLPQNISERIKRLAADITAGSSSPYQKALSIESYLENNYEYNLEYQPAPEGQEANDWFLFDEKKGVCTNFNSAFVVLARCAGIPSRLVDGYQIDPEASEQVVYASQAHAWSEIKLKDLGWIAIDATGKGSGALITETNITEVDLPVVKGKTFSIRGTVTSSDNSPVNGVPLKLFINPRKETTGGIPVGNGTSTMGVFDITAEIPVETQVGQYQLMAHCLGGIKYRDSWSDPDVTVMAETFIDLEAPSRIKTSEQLMLKGILREESSKPVSGQKVDIYLKDLLITTLTTDEQGEFSIWQSFSDSGEYNLRASFKGSEYYLASESEIDFEVLTPTQLRLTTPLKASLKQAFTVEGYLSEEESRLAFPGQEIIIMVDGVPSGEKPVTNAEGVFSFRYTFEEEGLHLFEARYAGVPYFFESQAESVIEIIPAPVPAKSSNNVWLFPVIVLAVVLISLGVFYFLRRRRRLIPSVEALTDEDIPEPAEEEEETEEYELEEDETEVLNDQITLSIEFPDIEFPFPDVWGEGEDLRAICSLKKTDGTPLAAKQIDLLIGKSANRVTTDAGGSVIVQCTFQKKGQYQVSARYSGENDQEPLLTVRTIRIVDYREEIVGLFKSLLEWLRNKGLDLPSRATPREIKQIISESSRVISPAALAKIIVCFEEADYSMHTIDRTNYKTMYLAQKEIRDYEPTPPAAE